MIRLDDLEAKCKAATDPIWTPGPREYYEAMTPTTALALIRVARAAIKISDFSIHSAFDELNEALEEIE